MPRLRSTVVVTALALGMFVSARITPWTHDVTAAGETNAYFDALVSRAGFWKGYSLRPRPGEPISSPYYASQLDTPRNGGYQNSSNDPLFVTYDATMDAAKVVIPAWLQVGFSSTTLSAMTAADTKIYPTVYTGSYGVVGRQIKVDTEVMLITAIDANTVSPRGLTVARGQYGTKPAAHVAGAALYVGNNSLPNQLRVPLNTEDGSTYVFTWDVFYTSSFVKTGLAGNKSFQFSSGGDGVWLEVKTRMDGGSQVTRPPGFNPLAHVGGLDVRSYNKLGGDANWSSTDGNLLGSSVAKNEPIEPINQRFVIHPDRWMRYWVQIDQRANDYDYFDMWVADEVQAPVQVYKRVPVSVRTKDSSINKFWIEFNDSASRLPAERTTDFRDLVAYMRNFAALRNVGDIQPLLLRPVPGVVPVAGPAPPGNVRVTSAP